MKYICIYLFFNFFQAETIFLNQDLEEKNENQENEEEEEEDKLFWLEACYKALTQHRKNKHVQVGIS
jgi:leucine-rich repeat kinase 2